MPRKLTHRRTDPQTFHRARDLRHNMSPCERLLWSKLRNQQLEGLRFRRQHAIGPFITDFYCAEHKLIVELDGRSHDDRLEYDERRTRWLESQGYRVLRFKNDDAQHRMDGVLMAIVEACRA